MSYSRRLENVLQQIETVGDNLNKNFDTRISKYLISKDTSVKFKKVYNIVFSNVIIHSFFNIYTFCWECVQICVPVYSLDYINI
jgi:hypothetical protein